MSFDDPLTTPFCGLVLITRARAFQELVLWFAFACNGHQRDLYFQQGYDDDIFLPNYRRYAFKDYYSRICKVPEFESNHGGRVRGSTREYFAARTTDAYGSTVPDLNAAKTFGPGDSEGKGTVGLHPFLLHVHPSNGNSSGDSCCTSAVRCKT